MGKNLLIILLALGLGLSVWLSTRVEPPDPREGESSSSEPLREWSDLLENEFPDVALGFCLLDEDGKVLSKLNEKVPLIPASSFKTLTTVAALDLLGPEFRFSTRVTSAPLTGGTISGDLAIRGGGDPTLALVDLQTMAAKLVKAGVKRIEGGVVGDGSLFPGNMVGDFWGWGDIGNGYGSPFSGLNLEHNRFLAVFRPGEKVGDQAALLGSRPAVPGVEWLNDVTTGAANSGDGVMIYGGPRATRIHLTGTVPIGENFGVRGAVPDPPQFAAYHLARLLEKEGVTIARSARAMLRGEVIAGEHEWLTHESATLAEILPGLHARSDNHETECLFQMMGIKKGHPPAQVLEEYWKKRAVERVRIVDGSGLSRADFIAPEDLARVQWSALQTEAADLYWNSLSQSRDGGARWKVGGMSSVRSWAGYIEGKAGKRLSFSLMINHFRDGSSLNRIRDEFVELGAKTF